jgi:hypothetical protein
MNDNQEHLAFNHQIGLALSQWQHDVEFALYAVAAACSGRAPPADTYTAFFEHRNFRHKLKQVDDLVWQKVQGTALLADWRKLHSRIETAEEGRNALAHRWVLIYPNGKPGRRWCLLPRIGTRSQQAPDRPPNGALCVRDISQLFFRFSALGRSLWNFAARVRGEPERFPKELEQERKPLTLSELTHEIRVLAGCLG